MMRYRFYALSMLVAVILSNGPASRAADPPAATAPSTQQAVNRFYGVVTAVDPKANTFIVDGQTYHVTAESHLTKAADDKVTTLADAVVGEPARGTYTRSADGTMNVTKVRFGKKTGGGKSGGGKKKPSSGDSATSQPHS